ncbi:MAG: 6-carboxytetrahydropterin synthase [Verrucomicrobiae bacterium]|nr:6-carboxytetrahydropterin synthase [Verrucomicrobiae bacterium]
MPYRICKIIKVENGHMLSKHKGGCHFPHGHSRRIELVLESGKLDKNDMVCDFAVLKSALKEFLDTLDHSMCINTRDPLYKTLKKVYGNRVIGFDNQDPTSEVVARMIYCQVKKLLKGAPKSGHKKPIPSKGVRLVRVRVWETSTCWAEYEEQAP